ncbi:MAG: response regulator [Leptolyngbyaceae cyanobacterium bins.59]|nr:response regulator [Leptolyngbyaceae cyanobacterium bins.59]
MVDQLSSFASEVTRVAREVGTEGKLGGQANVTGVAGTWKDLTDNVNSMAGNLTAQVRGIARVVTAVANGDLKRKLMLDAKGEIETLADTINEMIDTLATFADQVTTVAREVGIEGKLGGQAKVPGAAGTWRALTDNVNELAATLTTQLRAIAEVATAVTKGDLTRSISVQAEGEVAVLKDNINQMIANLRETTQKNNEQDWLKTNLAKFTRMLQGQRDLETVSKLILSELAPLVSAQHGVFYLMDAVDHSQAMLKLISTYAYRERKHLGHQFRLGEGLVGQCALEKERILVTDVPDDYVKINSGLGESSPLNVVVLPVLFEGQVTAVIELASFRRFSEIHLSFFDQLTESIAIVLNTIAASMRTEELLKQSQSLAEELQTQQKELTETNKRLEQQAQSLKASEELLKSQQEQLRQTNEELEEKARLLELQNQEVERKNAEIEQARQSLEEKAEQLALTSRYKSEFLANMSHELRTPLNSLLILAKLLSDNNDGNLQTKQVEYARTIHSAGTDLLGLINDILDLAKIESGTMSVEIDQMLFTELQTHMVRTFQQVAQDKNLEFTVDFSERLPRAIYTDPKRLQQVLKNLLSNAFKFTETGRVVLQVQMVNSGWNPNNTTLNRADMVIAFAVVDTGIGIPYDKQKVIFEAFQQADGTTSRKYGGTGLGLSISREIARLLGGEIQLVSSPGQGSTFTLYLPQTFIGQTVDAQAADRAFSSRRFPNQPRLTPQGGPMNVPVRPLPPAPTVTYPVKPYVLRELEIEDDRQAIHAGDRVLLIIEDDADFARILLEMARQQGFKGIVSFRSDAGLVMAQDFKPDAIMLDIRMPGMDGWTVLDRLKHDPTTRHIPVNIVSVDEGLQRSLQLGAFAYVQKPASSEALNTALSEIRAYVERQVKTLLIIEDDETQRLSIAELVGANDVQTTGVGSGEEALEALRNGHFDCVVLALGLPDMTGFELIERIKQELHLRNMPIIVYTRKDLTRQEEQEIRRMADTLIIKDVRSPERLLDETTLFLHRLQANLREVQREMLERLYQTDPVLAGKKVLIVDDDVRNIFALTSMLEQHHMEIIYAENGRDGINTLINNPDIDVVLMDVMMPEMDGYETMQAIRDREEFLPLPIIALTAKAMMGDREKCLEAGASDYIPKPVDTEQLLSLLRVWLNQ